MYLNKRLLLLENDLLCVCACVCVLVGGYGPGGRIERGEGMDEWKFSRIKSVIEISLNLVESSTKWDSWKLRGRDDHTNKEVSE